MSAAHYGDLPQDPQDAAKDTGLTAADASACDAGAPLPPSRPAPIDARGSKITALQLTVLKEACQPLLEESKREADAAMSLEAYDYPARLKNSLMHLQDILLKGIAQDERGQA